MAKIRNGNNVKVVTFENSFGVHHQARQPGFCGVVSNLSWHNGDVMDGLRKMFACKSDEYISAIEITDEGIKAQFQRYPE